MECFVGATFSVSSSEIRSRCRSRPNVAFARQVGMYLAHVGCGLPMSEVGRLFSRDRRTVAHACALVEDRRDDPQLDRALAILEFALVANSHPSLARKERAR